MAPARQGVAKHTHDHLIPELDMILPAPAPVADRNVIFQRAWPWIQRIVMGIVEYVAPLLVERCLVADVERPEIMRPQYGAQPAAVAAPAPPPYAHLQAPQVRVVYRIRPGRALCVMAMAVMIFAPLLSITHVSAADLAFPVEGFVEIAMGETRADKLSWTLVSGMKLVATESPLEVCAA